MEATDACPVCLSPLRHRDCIETGPVGLEIWTRESSAVPAPRDMLKTRRALLEKFEVKAR